MITRIIYFTVKLFRIDVITVLSIRGFLIERGKQLLKKSEVTDYNKYHEKKKWEIYNYFYLHTITEICNMPVANDWLKKALMMPLEERRSMIEQENKAISISKQCDLLSIHRSDVYYVPVSEK